MNKLIVLFFVIIVTNVHAQNNTIPIPSANSFVYNFLGETMVMKIDGNSYVTYRVGTNDTKTFLFGGEYNPSTHETTINKVYTYNKDGSVTIVIESNPFKHVYTGSIDDNGDYLIGYEDVYTTGGSVEDGGWSWCMHYSYSGKSDLPNGYPIPYESHTVGVN